MRETLNSSLILQNLKGSQLGSITPKILGGSKAKQLQIPYQVGIYDKPMQSNQVNR
jgi:hypothetical protein